ncbi:O-acetyl-ADP-ribose deacetylase 1 [Biomphalaria pfeifferi]|uniref:O-acetyl-ADP-ribose deacetylase 1 n=1 Tax=Biomphalaria pfeifferi TaxID=112525 RepID=A0AAD8BF91_BIOPF|nr:O-acetyl-ADP-ribose deacetylase 1 [Biomphalaria pfeifferi]
MALTFIEKEGDLFTCSNTASLAHCVSEDLIMGKGIAVEFKRRFGQVEELCKQKSTVGQFAVLQDGERYIYYLVTKPKYDKKPSEVNVKYCLREMRDHILQHGVKELCMPRIGCGLDELDWKKVKEIIKTVFQGCPITVTIYHQAEHTLAPENNSSQCFTEVDGDLFDCPSTWSMAHGVGEDLVMRIGIAETFLKRFGQLDLLNSQKATVGQCAVLKDQSRYIYYMIIKKLCNQQVQESSLRQALLFMRDHCKSHGVKQLAMPKVGKGHNSLEWDKVRRLINDVFAQTDIHVTVYNYVK